MRSIQVTAIQQAHQGPPPANHEALAAAVRQAAAAGAELILLQELHNDGYFCQTEDPALCDGAEAIPGPATERLAELARETNTVLVASLFERRAPGLYHNTAVVLDRAAGLVGRYRKMHIPDDPGFYEKFYFTPGDLGFCPIDTSLGRLGVLVCWDQWYPEAARLMALAGADILLYPTAIGWDDRDSAAEQARQLDAWRTVQRGHAIANGLPLVACNRIGLEPDPSGQGPGIRFWGHSFCCGPQGEILAEAPADEPTLLSVRVDLAQSERVRRIWPFLRDRRVESYEGLTRRWLGP